MGSIKNKKVKVKKTLDMDKPIFISKKDPNGYKEIWVYNPMLDGDISQYINNPNFAISN